MILDMNSMLICDEQGFRVEDIKTGQKNMAMSIFDMGKNLDKNVFNIDGWTINPCREVALAEPEICQLTGKFPKKRGRPKMEEKFFYDPYEEKSLFVGIDTADVKIGDVVILGPISKSGYVTKIIGSNTVKINWQITYKE